MSKLLKLKKWMTVADAAARLTGTFGELVREEDIYRFALDGHLLLSVFFVNEVPSRYCRAVRSEEIEWKVVPSLDGVSVVRLPTQGRILTVGQSLYLVEFGITNLEGLWDLPLIGGERIDVEFAFQRVSGGPEVTAVSLEGIFVRSPEGALYEIQDGNHPAGALPDDCMFAVRADALLQFEQSMNEDASKLEKPLQPRERETLLNIIAVMLEFLQNPRPGRTSEAAVIAEMIENYGEKPGIKERTLQEKFSLAKRNFARE